jgi:hypothetical protein
MVATACVILRQCISAEVHGNQQSSIVEVHKPIGSVLVYATIRSHHHLRACPVWAFAAASAFALAQETGGLGRTPTTAP